MLDVTVVGPVCVADDPVSTCTGVHGVTCCCSCCAAGSQGDVVVASTTVDDVAAETRSDDVTAGIAIDGHRLGEHSEVDGVDSVATVCNGAAGSATCSNSLDGVVTSTTVDGVVGEGVGSRGRSVDADAVVAKVTGSQYGFLVATTKGDLVVSLSTEEVEEVVVAEVVTSLPLLPLTVEPEVVPRVKVSLP